MKHLKKTFLFTALLGLASGAMADDISVSYQENTSNTVFDSPTTYTLSGTSYTSYYRIPAIAKLQDGSLLSICDLRINGSGDIGSGIHIDVVGKKSTNNGTSWDSSQSFIANGESSSGYDYAHGDAAIVADRETGKIIVLCNGGETAYSAGGCLLGQYYSTDNGANWDGGQITLTSAFSNAGLSVSKKFFTSGRIIQSAKVKVGTYYRIYCALCSGNGSIVMYSDDFGTNWAVLGSKIAYSYGDETVLEELPDGNLLLSARLSGSGRGFNVFKYSDLSTGAGSWQTSASSTYFNNVNHCNGEMLLLPTKNSKYYVLLHTLPDLSGERQNVTVYYKLINTAEDDYLSPSFYSTGWAVLKQMGSTTSCYSTMVADQNGNVAYLVEDTNYNGGYDIVYKNFTVNVTGLPSEETPKSYYIYNVGQKRYLNVSGNTVSLDKTGTQFTATKDETTGDYALTTADGTALSTDFRGDIICSNDGYYTGWKLSLDNKTDSIYSLAVLEDEDLYAYSYMYYNETVGTITKSAAKTALANGQWKLLAEQSAPVEPDPEPVTTVTLDESATTYSKPENMAETVDVTLVRTPLVAGVKNTFCVPFDMTAEQVAEAFGENCSLYRYSAYNSTLNKVYFCSCSEIEAGKPYIVIPETVPTESFYTIMSVPSESFVSEAGFTTHGAYTLYSSFIDKTFAGYYTYEETTGILKYASNDRDLKGFRAYFLSNSSEAKALTDISFDDATGIETVQGSRFKVQGQDYYNVMGQKVNADAKGIVVSDGKKTFNK